MGREKRKSKVAEDIIRLQNDDGTWGNSFHSLGIPRRKHFLTTEQALRRLKVLGFIMEDDPIKNLPDVFASKETVKYLSAIQLLSGYKLAKEKLGFAAHWLLNNMEQTGR